MKLKVADQLHISGVNDNKTMPKNMEFEVSDSVGADLVKRGLAYDAKTKREDFDASQRAKKDQGGAPKNKALQEQQNKIIGSKKAEVKKGAAAPTNVGKKKSGDADNGDNGGASESSEA